MKKETKEEEAVIKEAVNNLEKKYGKNILIKMDDQIKCKVKTISTGVLSLDDVLGSGAPLGRIVEIFGEESSGKSTLSQFLIAQIQKQGGRAALIDIENAFDGEYAKNIGVDVSKLLVSQAESLEAAFDVLKELVATKLIDVIVIDSVAALVPLKEIEGKEMLKETMALQARLIGKALRILSGPIARSNTIVIFINQTRMKVGLVFGSPDTTPGGKALKFYSSIRLKVNKGTKIVDKNDVQIGNQIKVTAVKNKVGFPWQSTVLDLYYAKGIDIIADIFDVAIKKEIIIKTGNTYTFGEKTLGVGRDKSINTIKENDKLYEEIKKTIINNLNTNKNNESKTN